MADFSLDYTFKNVTPIIMIVEQNVEQYDEECTVFAETFATDSVSGYHLHNNSGNVDRHCNLVASSNSDQFRLSIGGRDDYDRDSRASHDSVEMYFFNHDEHYACASAILEWIIQGKRPDRRSY